MAYSTANPPQKVSGGIGSGVAVWAYADEDVVATVRGADYFSNGEDLGMKVGDLVLHADTTTPLPTLLQVSAISAGGAATVV